MAHQRRRVGKASQAKQAYRTIEENPISPVFIVYLVSALFTTVLIRDSLFILCTHVVTLVASIAQSSINLIAYASSRLVAGSEATKEILMKLFLLSLKFTYMSIMFIPNLLDSILNRIVDCTMLILFKMVRPITIFWILYQLAYTKDSKGFSKRVADNHAKLFAALVKILTPIIGYILGRGFPMIFPQLYRKYVVPHLAPERANAVPYYDRRRPRAYRGEPQLSYFGISPSNSEYRHSRTQDRVPLRLDRRPTTFGFHSPSPSSLMVGPQLSQRVSTSAPWSQGLDPYRYPAAWQPSSGLTGGISVPQYQFATVPPVEYQLQDRLEPEPMELDIADATIADDPWEMMEVEDEDVEMADPPATLTSAPNPPSSLPPATAAPVYNLPQIPTASSFSHWTSPVAHSSPAPSFKGLLPPQWTPPAPRDSIPTSSSAPIIVPGASQPSGPEVYTAHVPEEVLHSELSDRIALASMSLPLGIYSWDNWRRIELQRRAYNRKTDANIKKIQFCNTKFVLQPGDRLLQECVGLSTVEFFVKYADYMGFPESAMTNHHAFNQLLGDINSLTDKVFFETVVLAEIATKEPDLDVEVIGRVPS